MTGLTAGEIRVSVTVDDICHDEQMTVWTDEILQDLMEWIALTNYDDVIAAHSATENTIRSIVETTILRAIAAQTEEIPA